jgi:long-chain acyl-CoA synthetase
MRDHLATLLDDFRRYDHEVAVVRMRGNRRQATSYCEIAHLAGRFAALLAQSGIGPGDRVVLWAENGAEWVAAFYGIMLRGALAVPLDAYGSADFAARVAADVKPKLATGDAVLMARLPGDFPRIAFEDWPASLPVQEIGAVEGLSRNTPLQILFTSGTTGEPKGIVHTHGNVLASVGPIEDGARPYMRYEKYVHPLRFLHTLPLSHVFGQTMGLWVPAIFAAEVHFESRMVAPRLIETIKRERISVLAAVPRIIGLLKTHLEMSDPNLAARVAGSQGLKAWQRWWRFRKVHRAFGLKFWAFVSGGGALAGPLEQFWNALGFVVVQGYGMTETTALITLNHPFHVARGTIGKPLPGREVKIGPDGEVLVRGPMISTATWSGGELRQRESEWLATGDLAEEQDTGELKFLGRKSEVIVTAAGVNIHPEDLEAAIEQEPGVTGCAVVPIETASGPEPYAVLAVRGNDSHAAEAVARANMRLAEFQRVRRWALWPEPDLPRTTTGKVRRKAVAAWVAEVQAVAEGKERPEDAGFAAGGDWLLGTIAQITGETPHGVGDELRLSEDLHLDSLGKVQLEAALEERLGELPSDGAIDQAVTLGDLRKLVGAETMAQPAMHEPPLWERHPRASGDPLPLPALNADATRLESTDVPVATPPTGPLAEAMALPAAEKSAYLYPRWPWWKPVEWLRTAFLEGIAMPLVRFLADPHVALKRAVRRTLGDMEPMLIVSNHVTAYDGPLVQYALPEPVRRKIAAAMSGEMLEDFRHFRNPERAPGKTRFMLFGPVAYFLVTALFNVFPLPRRRDFQRSFAHAGEALDRGYHVLVFPEGTRSAAGKLAPFRPGIGLLVKQSQTAVLPVAIRGLGELKARGRGWFRSGSVEIRVGAPLRFRPEETEAAITERLHAEVEMLLTEE